MAKLVRHLILDQETVGSSPTSPGILNGTRVGISATPLLAVCLHFVLHYAKR